MPRFVANCRFMGMSRSAMVPYAPKISYRCGDVTFFVSFSITIFELRGMGICAGGVALRV